MMTPFEVLADLLAIAKIVLLVNSSDFFDTFRIGGYRTPRHRWPPLAGLVVHTLVG